MFTYNFALHDAKVKSALAELEIYRLIINPHSRHHRMMREFEKSLQETKVHSPNYPTALVCTEAERKSYMKQVQAYVRQMNVQSSLAVSLVTEAAFTAESLLNLFIAVLMNTLLRNSANLLEAALFEKWKDKLERLQLHCDHIVVTPDSSHTAVKGIEKVFKRRNRVAHSYPDVEHLCAETMWFDRKVPILPNCGPYVEYQLGADALVPTRAEPLECPDLVEEFENYLFGLVEPAAVDELRFFSKSNPIGFSEKTKRYGVPFADTLNMVLLTGKS